METFLVDPLQVAADYVESLVDHTAAGSATEVLGPRQFSVVRIHNGIVSVRGEHVPIDRRPAFPEHPVSEGHC